MRRLWTLLTALVLVAAPLVAGGGEPLSGVCVGGLNMVACVPPEGT